MPEMWLPESRANQSTLFPFSTELLNADPAADGSAAPLWHANKHRSHLKAALIRDAICSL